VLIEWACLATREQIRLTDHSHDELNFLRESDNQALRLDQISNDRRYHKNCQKGVLGKCLNDVPWDEGIDELLKR
jgi:hypothetical protein